MASFNHTVARFAVWNLAGNDRFPGGDGDGISPEDRKSWHQVLGLALLDAEFVTLVEVFPESILIFWQSAWPRRGWIMLLPIWRSRIAIWA